MLKAIHKKPYNQKRKPLRIGLRAIPIISGVTLAGVLTASGLAHAETSGTVDLTANVAEAGLSLTLSNTAVSLNLAAPYEGTAFDSKAITVSVSARNGYQLLMYGNPSLTSGTGASANTISPLDSNCSTGCSSGTNFTTNRWGYGITSTSSEDVVYKPLLSGYNQIKTATGDVAENTIVNFGAKVNYEQAPGAYTTTLNFLAVANVTTPTQIFMQDLADSDKAATYCNTDSPTLLKDARDNKSYLVQRLADGKCWMLDNLAFDPTAYFTNGGTVANLATNTNADETTLGYFKNGGGSGQYASSGVTTEWKLTSTENTATCTSDPTQCTDNWTVPRVNTSNISNYQYPAWSPNSTSENHDGSVPSYGSYNIGVYYNYCAASAGSYCYAKNQGTGNASSDICPAGWKLPTGVSSGEFSVLYTSGGNSYSDTVNNIVGYGFRATFSTPLSGDVDYSLGAVINVRGGGHWWSSSRGSNNNMYHLVMNNATVSFASNNRTYGFSIRCILK